MTGNDVRHMALRANYSVVLAKDTHGKEYICEGQMYISNMVVSLIGSNGTRFAGFFCF